MSLIEVETEDMSFGSAAVGRFTPQGETRAMVVFIEGAAPRERVRAKLTKSHKSYWEGELVEVIRPSVDRVEPPCEVFGRCGGCQWQHLSYEAQLRAKAKILVHQIARALRAQEDAIRARLTTHGASEPFGYRARIQVRGDRKGLGFFAGSSHTIVHASRCLVAHPDLQEAWSRLAASGSRIEELASATGQFKVEWTRTESGQVLEAINRKHGALGFTQVNPAQNAKLTQIVAELAGAGGLLLDLFGGDGNLSNKLLGKFRRVVSVDSFGEGEDPVTVKAPPDQGRIFIKQRVEDFLIEERWREWPEQELCIIADPPREGLKGSVERIARIGAARLILVSCDPTTLARDLATFATHGYRLGRLHLIDMFPQTYHIESVAELASNSLDTNGASF